MGEAEFMASAELFPQWSPRAKHLVRGQGTTPPEADEKSTNKTHFATKIASNFVENFKSHFISMDRVRFVMVEGEFPGHWF